MIQSRILHWGDYPDGSRTIYHKGSHKEEEEEEDWSLRENM